MNPNTQQILRSPGGRFALYGKLAELLVIMEAHTATKYLSPSHVIRATRKVFNNRIPKRARTIEIMFTDGKPNYHARQFIKSCIKAGEKFPIKNIQLKHFPKKRK